MPFLKKLDNWYLIQLTDLVATGKLTNGMHITTRKVLMVDLKEKLLITSDGNYRLGLPDKLWINTQNAFDILNGVYNGN